jgi:diguanylate cyclase (GGDEF)-like protein
MIDVDHFKRLNDKQGHAAGDAALRQLGAVVQQHIRPYDVAGRLGGEEFCVLVVDGALPAALQTAERLRLAVQEASRSEPSAAAVTISVGVSEALPDDPGLAAVMARADAALYRAKQAGRDRVELA